MLRAARVINPFIGWGLLKGSLADKSALLQEAPLLHYFLVPRLLMADSLLAARLPAPTLPRPLTGLRHPWVRKSACTRAQVQFRWHRYSTDLPQIGPTVFKLTCIKSPIYKLVGPSQTLGSRRYSDEVFNGEVAFWENTGLVQPRVRLSRQRGWLRELWAAGDFIRLGDAAYGTEKASSNPSRSIALIAAGHRSVTSFTIN